MNGMEDLPFSFFDLLRVGLVILRPSEGQIPDDALSTRVTFRLTSLSLHNSERTGYAKMSIDIYLIAG